MKIIYLQTVIAVPVERVAEYQKAIDNFAQLIDDNPQLVVRKKRFRNDKNIKIKICIPVLAEDADLDLVATLDNLVEVVD
jgi:hypothetical protein